MRDFEMVRAKLVGYLQSGTRVKNAYPVSDKSSAAIYARAIYSLRNGNLGTAKTGTKTLISREPQNPYFYELLGDIEFQFGNYDQSVLAYQKSLDILGNAHQIQTALALVLTERAKAGDADKAIELCRRALLSEQTPLAFWTLGKAFGENDGRSDWAMAEYYRMIRKNSEMKKYAKQAQKKLEKGSPEYIKAGDLL